MSLNLFLCVFIIIGKDEKSGVQNSVFEADKKMHASKPKTISTDKMYLDRVIEHLSVIKQHKMDKEYKVRNSSCGLVRLELTRDPRTLTVTWGLGS